MVIEKKLCDRCNVEILDIPNNVNQYLPTYILHQRKRGAIEKIDLCRECQEELDTLLVKWLIDGEMKNE